MSALGALLPSMLADPDWGLTPVLATILASAALAGMFFGGYGFGLLADRAGRKPAFLLCLSLFSLSSLAAAMAPSPAFFAVARFICGAGVGGIVPICSALVYEFSPADKANHRYTLMYSGYTIGILAASLAAIWLLDHHSWRLVMALGAMPLLLLPLMVRLLPESIAFLHLQGRHDEANDVASLYGLPTSPIVAEDKAVETGRELRAILAPGLRLATFGFWLATFAGMIVVYGLTTWLPQIMRGAGYALGSAILFLAVFAVASSVGGVLLGRIADKIGRPVTIFSTFLVGAISICALAYPWPIYLTYIIVAFGGIGTIGAAVLVTGYLAAYFPAQVRATAVGACLSVSRSGAICGPVVGGFVAANHLPISWNFWAYSAAALLAGAAILLPPMKKAAA